MSERRLEEIRRELHEARKELDQAQGKFGDQPQWRGLQLAHERIANAYWNLAREAFSFAMKYKAELDAAREEVRLVRAGEQRVDDN